jgi:tyrosinase
MPDLDPAALAQLRRRGDELFRTLYNERPVAVAAGQEDRQPQVIRDRENGTEIDPNLAFSGFDRAHAGTALQLADRFWSLVTDAPDETGLAAVLDAAEAELATQNSDLVKYALAVFITNNPVGRNLYIPPLIAQSPEQFIPSHPNTSPATAALGGLGDEAKLDYFREDPDFNVHHAQWHRVYPFDGVPDASGGRVLKDRQGELFWYMHQQMLARYDTDRIALDLSPTDAFDDYSALVEGYDVEPVVGTPFRSRLPNRRISSIAFGLPGSPPGGVLDTNDLAAHRDLLLDAARTGRFEVNGQVVPLTPDSTGANLLGCTLEANLGSVLLTDDVGSNNGLHNIGHGFFSALSPQPGGVMRSPTVAVRDPIFHRWHRHVDDLFVEWQEQLPENDVADGAAPVTIRKGADGRSTDIGLALLRDLAPGTADGPAFDGTAFDGTAFDGATFGATAFGGDHWDTPITECPDGIGKLTSELETTIGTYQLVFPNGDEFPIFHVDHAEFAYFFRLENDSDADQQVTVRVFLAAAAHAHDRRWWIEMDKFLQPIGGGERLVVYRPARLSSVVRKPARRPLDPVAGPEDPNDDYCRCGWPYHMLLPRGRDEEGGMPFRLLVVVTDAVADLAGAETRCSSLSFCGSRDGTYPETRLMGYPFDRPFTSRTIEDVIADPALRHVAALDLAVRHRPTG